MQIKFLLLFCLIAICSCKPQIKVDEETHIQKLNMHGKIKSFKEVSYVAKMKNGKIIKGEKNRDFLSSLDDFENDDFVINFNTNGNITDYTFYDYLGKIDKKDTCVYYSKEIEQKILDENPESEGSDQAWQIHFLYKWKSKDSVEYSNETKASYHFDNLGNLTLIDYGDLEKTTFKYDTKKNLIEEKSFDENGELTQNETYEYKYDKNNNWIEKIKFENKIPTYIFERQIEYYK